MGRDSVHEESRPVVKSRRGAEVFRSGAGRSQVAGSIVERAFYGGWNLAGSLCEPEELQEGGGGAVLPARRSWEPDGGFSWRAAQQRDALFDDGSGCAAGAEGQGQRGQTELHRACADGESQRNGGGYDGDTGHRDRRTGCGAADGGGDSR